MGQEPVDLWWIWRGELFWVLEGNSAHHEYISTSTYCISVHNFQEIILNQTSSWAYMYWKMIFLFLRWEYVIVPWRVTNGSPQGLDVSTGAKAARQHEGGTPPGGQDGGSGDHSFLDS